MPKNTPPIFNSVLAKDINHPQKANKINAANSVAIIYINASQRLSFDDNIKKV